MKLAAVSEAITSLADGFIPDELKGDRDRLNQARVFLISHLFGPCLGSAVPATLFVLDPEPGYELVVLTISILSFWAFPPLLRLTGRYEFLAIFSVQNLMFCILWSCYFYGGVKSPTLPWVLIIPLLAFFYIGASTRLRVTVTAMFLGNVAVFLYLYSAYPPPEKGLPLEDIENLAIISMMAVSLYVSMMAVYFSNIYEAQSEMEALLHQRLARAAELREATALAERASAAKAEFVAKTSHELRTPLNAIIGYSQILREDAESEDDLETIRDLDRIIDASVHLLKLINEVLALAKIDAGKMEIFEEDVVVADLIRTVVESYRAQAEAAGNVLNVNVAADVGTLVLDERKVEQILAQIVDNAVKFTSHGMIVVSAALKDVQARASLVIEVQDTGCGITPEDVGQLFEHFTVVGDTSSSKYGGTGLGLALSRKMSRLLGGDVTVTSARAKGSTFVITLPARRSDGRSETNRGQDADADSGKISAGRAAA